jgi:hypothetical protein
VVVFLLRGQLFFGASSLVFTMSAMARVALVTSCTSVRSFRVLLAKTDLLSIIIWQAWALLCAKIFVSGVGIVALVALAYKFWVHQTLHLLVKCD